MASNNENKFEDHSRMAHEKLVDLKCSTLKLCQNFFLDVSPDTKFSSISDTTTKINTHFNNEMRKILDWLIDLLRQSGEASSPVVTQGIAILVKLAEWIYPILRSIAPDLSIMLDQLAAKLIDVEIVNEIWCESWPKIVETAGEDPVPSLEVFLQKVNAK